MERPYTEEELRQQLQFLDNSNPVWQSISQIIKTAIDNSIDCALTDGISQDDRTWRSGYAQAMRDVESTLNNYRKDPSKKV
tara:strand:- start:44 stop:286 length:243 start_codon:yes stop_codon:yes gene_type:complete